MKATVAKEIAVNANQPTDELQYILNRILECAERGYFDVHIASDFLGGKEIAHLMSLGYHTTLTADSLTISWA